MHKFTKNWYRTKKIFSGYGLHNHSLKYCEITKKEKVSIFMKQDIENILSGIYCRPLNKEEQDNWTAY